MATQSKAVITSATLATMSASDRLAFYREAAKNLAPAKAGSAVDHVVVRANVAAAELVNAFADGRDAYRVTRAMRGQ